MQTNRAKVQIRAFLFFVLAFMICAVVGTVSHEYGHIVVAELLGYETELHYGSMDYVSDRETSFFEKAEHDGFAITLGGPVQTMLTGSIGLMILFFRKEAIKVSGLGMYDWVGVFLSLFWLREVFNGAVGIGLGLLSGSGIYFGGDEAEISAALGLSQGALPLILGLAGLTISLYVIFRVVPSQMRNAFIGAGFIGATGGFILWMFIVGPVVLP